MRFINFEALQNRTPEHEKAELLKIKYRLAEAELIHAREHSNIANKCVYSALTHMSAIPELHVKLHNWDSLIYDSTYSKEAYLYARRIFFEMKRMYDGGVT